MHEQSLMNHLMKKIIDLAAIQKATKVIKVRVKLGALSHMSASHFKEHFDIAAKGTIAENATIETEESQDINDLHAADVILKQISIL